MARQTLSFLRRRLKEAGIHPANKFGQNFLIDLNLVELLAEAAELGPSDVVLEVGTGTGSLTAKLAERAAAVVTVEIDPQLYQLAGEELHEFENVVRLHQDALHNKNRLDDRLLAAVAEQLAAVTESRFKLAANLPYNIATPLLSNLLAQPPLPHLMAATIQKELAERIAAAPGSKDYGALSIWIQAQCEVEIVRVMPPSVFWPQPKVESAIIRIRPDPALRARLPDPEYFHRFVRGMFFHRRKFLRANLLSWYKHELQKPQVDEVLAALGIANETRSEQLSVDDMIALCEVFRQVTGG